MAIDRAQAMLERAEYHAQQMVWRLSQELDACYAAAAQGYAVDCSQVYYALAEAEQELDHIRNVKRRLETVLRPYYHARNDLERALTTELAQATTFLDRRITALEAYNATAIIGTAVAVAGAGILTLMGGVIGALRQSRGNLNRVLGRSGEEIAAVVLSRRFGLQELPFTQPAQGFDRVFSAPGLPVIVMESKVSASGTLRLGNTQSGQQGSPGWTEQVTGRMTDPASAQWTRPTNASAAWSRRSGQRMCRLSRWSPTPTARSRMSMSAKLAATGN